MFVIDTETGGFDPERHSILSVGGVVWDDGKVIDEIEILIKEENIQADKEALSVNRICLTELAEKGLGPAESIYQLEAFLSKHFDMESPIPLCGHNVAFDAGFLKRLYRLGFCDYRKRFSHRLLDTASVLRFLNLADVIQVANPGLESALEFFAISVPENTRHTALADARATSALLTQLLKVIRR